MQTLLSVTWALAMQDGQDRVRAIQRHLIWQAVGFLCLLGGFYAIYRNKACSSLLPCACMFLQ